MQLQKALQLRNAIAGIFVRATATARFHFA
jgi:hypothetical protein